MQLVDEGELTNLDEISEHNIAYWLSRKIGRKLGSTTSAELLAMRDAVKISWSFIHFVRKLWGEMPLVVVVTDSQPLMHQIGSKQYKSEPRMQEELEYVLENLMELGAKRFAAANVLSSIHSRRGRRGPFQAEPLLARDVAAFSVPAQGAGGANERLLLWAETDDSHMAPFGSLDLRWAFRRFLHGDGEGVFTSKFPRKASRFPQTLRDKYGITDEWSVKEIRCVIDFEDLAPEEPPDCCLG
uniref:Uncharacterized protein n=1 Tax=Chromera velia CCMP2878 TaxID=1169474 RepID=A0A0G4GWT7_9ALVE|eukprot:Cvel_5329.t1-p1 / transcript=Cvel_5329.t1 / gene=Cvel_5329 / organism=Chromera_velia_CCMP2878 / gene_product=hypothetical protein / transcript_product=hypothetical protein / location=Cvel_scaffold247:34169-37359(-) / protein_length=241 / sequence_SO=supercontig / SO=protein_coding / is_pseudo=false